MVIWWLELIDALKVGTDIICKNKSFLFAKQWFHLAQNGIKGYKNDECAKIGRLKGLKLEHFEYYLIVMFKGITNFYV